MAIDPNRGTFVQKEYRYEIAEDPSIGQVQPNARKVTLKTNLDSAAAKALADELFDEHKQVAQAYRARLAGIETCSLDKFVGSPPTFSPMLPDWHATSGRTLRAVSVETDFGSFTQTVTMKGPL